MNSGSCLDVEVEEEEEEGKVDVGGGGDDAGWSSGGRYAGQTTGPALWTARCQATITCPNPHHLLSQEPIHSQAREKNAAIWRRREGEGCIVGMALRLSQAAKKTLTAVCRPQSAASQFILCHPTSGGTAGQRVGRVDKGGECQGHHLGEPPAPSR